MKRLIILVLIFGFIFSCKNHFDSKTKQNVNQKSNIDNDYINNDSIKIIAEMILKGESIWSKNENYLFPIMDSLTTNSADSRLFYFKVFSKICEQADGDVGEEIGSKVLKYLEFNPKEFIINSQLINDKTFMEMGWMAGIEISMSNDTLPEKKLEIIIKQTMDKCKDLKDDDLVKLDRFIQNIKDGLKSNKE